MMSYVGGNCEGSSVGMQLIAFSWGPSSILGWWPLSVIMRDCSRFHNLEIIVFP